MNALLKFSITVDHENKDTPVTVDIKLYSEDGVLVWRLDGENGDEVEAMPRPKSIEQAKEDARLCYPKNSTWNPKASWF